MYNNRTGSYQQQQPKQKKEYKTPRDIWDAENRNTFFKATPLFAGEDGNYDSRYHFSFVKHSGKPNCTQEYAIEIFVPMVKAGSDGSKVMGVNASGLAADMVNGNLFLEAERARKRQRETGNQYPDRLFTCVGGTPARRRSDGKAEFRQFSISPSNDPGYLVYQAMSCEGQETADGGIVPAKGMPSRRTITVKVADVYTKALGVNILLDWVAYKTLSLFSNLLKSKSEVNLMDNNNCIPEDTLVAALKKAIAEYCAENNMRFVPASALSGTGSNQTKAPAPVQKTQQPAPANTVNPAKTQEPKPAKNADKCAWIFIDSVCIGLMAVSINSENAVNVARDCFRRLKKTPQNFLCADKTTGAKLKSEIVAAKTSDGWLSPVKLVSNDGQNTTNYLNVRVIPYNTQCADVPTRAWVFVDNSIGILSIAVTKEDAIREARECFIRLKNTPEKFVCVDKAAAGNLPNEINTCEINKGWLTPVALTSTDGKNTENVLNVRVMPIV